MCQYGWSWWSVSRIQPHNPANELFVLWANLTVRDVLKRGPTFLQILQHPENELHDILVGNFLVFDGERAEYLNLSPQDSELVVVDRIYRRIFGIKYIEVATVY